MEDSLFVNCFQQLELKGLGDSIQSRRQSWSKHVPFKLRFLVIVSILVTLAQLSREFQIQIGHDGWFLAIMAGFMGLHGHFSARSLQQKLLTERGDGIRVMI